MKKITLIICILICNVSLFAQTATGNIETYVGGLIDNAPGSSGNDYTVPTTVQLITWNTVIDFLLADDLASARSTANGLNYQVTEFTDTTLSPNQVFYILEEQSPQSNYWGAYVFSKTPKRGNLIIQAPHIKNDTNTGKQAVYCFKNNLGRALFIGGTHRCNNSTASSCSGTTTTCSGSSDPYRVSDMAHNTQSVFQKTTENIFTYFPESVFIQLHGFGWSSGDPYVIMSNGTRETPAVDYATLIKDALFVEDNSLTFELPHINTSWNTLIGFTNTQGRLINYSVDNCTSSAEGTTGRFIHVEQELTKLRANSTAWQKMSNALASVFIEDADGDGVATGSDSDDADACDPDPYYANCGVCDVIVTSDDFDASVGNWIDGGANCVYTTHNAIGNKSMRLRYNTATSIMYTSPLDLSSYSGLKIDFSYFSADLLSGDVFVLETSTDGGSNFSIQKTWTYTTDFNNDLRYFESVFITGVSFTNNMVIRFRIESTNTGNTSSGVHIDNAVIRGCDDSLLSANDFEFEKSIKVFPNPSSGIFSVKGENINTIEVYSLLGEKVKIYNNSKKSTSVLMNLNNEANGVYILKIVSSVGVISKRIILF